MLILERQNNSDEQVSDCQSSVAACFQGEEIHIHLNCGGGGYTYLYML